MQLKTDQECAKRKNQIANQKRNAGKTIQINIYDALWNVIKWDLSDVCKRKVAEKKI